MRRGCSQDARTVTDVALDVGFADLSNFVRTFARAAGMSPNAFRKMRPVNRKIFQDRIGVLLNNPWEINPARCKSARTTKC
jgi:AraC family transcriptional regulator